MTLGVAFTVKASLSGLAPQTPEPGFIRSSTAAFAVLSIKERPAAGAFDVSVLPLDVGKQSLVLTCPVKGPQGEAELTSSPLALSVAEPETVRQNPELMDIKPPLRARRLWWPWLLAAALAAAAVILWRKRRRGPAALQSLAEAADPRSPEQKAEEELCALESSGLWGEGRHKDFYLRLTDIIRRYLERRCKVAATRLTTTELFRALRGRSNGREAVAAIREVFERGDLVKFAKSRAEPAWGAEDVASARALLRIQL